MAADLRGEDRDGVTQAHVTNVRADTGVDTVGALVVSSRSRAELADDTSARLSAFKVPTRWLVTSTRDDVPMTATAKVDKSALQQLLQQKGTDA